MALLRTASSAGQAGAGTPLSLPAPQQTRVIMNERLMQFRIGMFVIVAGLVLTMMIVWFGESPSMLARPGLPQGALSPRRPGCSKGSPVRKSGIRIGEVFAIAFDERPNQPDGVIVTLALERRYHAARGRRPAADPVVDRRRHDRHAARAPAPEFIATGKSPADAPIIEGEVAPDPSKALAAATKAFEKRRRHARVDQRGRRRASPRSPRAPRSSTTS